MGILHVKAMMNRDNDKKESPKALKVFLYAGGGVFLLFVLFVVFFAGCIGVGRLSNNIGLQKLSAQFESISHPVNSKPLERMTDIGILAGNGNHCDFIVAELRKYEGSRDDIEQAYADQTVPGFTPGYNAYVELYFAEDEYTDVWPLRQWREKLDGNNGEKRYIVFVLKTHQSFFMSSWDLRCN